ncbi:MAG: AtpZ/AtpI family protein [Thermoflavifilum sp.]|nr:AtpZ/AtpI family protein [Thermoflavifilum sp.]
MSQKPPHKRSSWIRYTSMTTELLVTIGLGVVVGLWIDRKLHLSIPIFTLILSLGALVVALWRIVKSSRDG